MIDADLDELEYPSEATIGDQWLRAPLTALKRHTGDRPVAPTDLHQRIAELAYQLFLRRGECHGHDLDDWLEAERLVLSPLTDRQNQTGEYPASGVL